MQFDPDVVTLFAAMEAANLPTLDQLPPNEARTLYQLQSDRVGGPVVEMAAVRPLEADGPGGPIRLRLYRPHGIADSMAPLLLYYHGGGFVIGDLDTHDKVCRQIAQRAACLVLAVDYRRAPEHIAPAQADDAEAALVWAAANATSFGADPSRIAVGGDSAGGTLSAVTALAARQRGIPLRAQILIYPSVDMRSDDTYPSRSTNAAVRPLTSALIAYFRSRFLPDDALATDWRLSPIVAPDKSGLAPALVIVAEGDTLRDEGIAYADALEAAGVPVSRLEVPGMIHGFLTLVGALKASDRVLDRIGEELRTRLAA